MAAATPPSPTCPPSRGRPRPTRRWTSREAGTCSPGLGAAFRLRRLSHYAFYNPARGRIEMHLVSLARQTVNVGNYRFAFVEGESIHTENSYKYSIEGFRALARSAGFTGRKVWLDPRGLFSLHGLVAS